MPGPPAPSAQAKDVGTIWFSVYSVFNPDVDDGAGAEMVAVGAAAVVTEYSTVVMLYKPSMLKVITW
jgi:hypothetical protein